MKKRLMRRSEIAQAPSPRLPQEARVARLFLADARRVLAEQHVPRVVECLKKLPEEDIWWRPNAASNSAGNLVLHLAGNVRQWIISGLGGEPDFRDRDREFEEQGPIPCLILRALLQKEVRTACSTLNRLTAEDLLKLHSIQKFRVTGLQAVAHVVEHFAYHSGQIIYLTKLRLGEDLRFTRLPGARRGKA